jgi:hypothetical protein
MMNVLDIAKTINEQIFWSIDKWTYFSWGVSKKIATIHNNMPSLKLRVTGLIHKGWVIISLDEGRDCYIITLQDVKGNIKSVHDEVYCDELGVTIDELVEKPSSMSDEKYKKLAMKDSRNKLR